MTNEEIIKNIATNLRKLRNKKGLTQEGLIKEIGGEKLSLRSYKSYENEFSNRVPLLEKIAIIADYYKCSIDYIIYNKDSVYSDSFTLRDNLKRISELVYSLILIPQREEDINSKYYGKYYFLAYDKEVNYYLDKIALLSKQKKDKYSYYDINDLKLLKYYHDAIEECNDLDIDYGPSINRLKKVMLESGNDFDEYYENNQKYILNKRKIAELEKYK